MSSETLCLRCSSDDSPTGQGESRPLGLKSKCQPVPAVDDGGRNAPLDESVEAVATSSALELPHTSLPETPASGVSREPKRQNQGNDTARTLEKPSKPSKKSKTTQVPANEHVPRAQKRNISGQNSGDISVAKTTVIAEEPALARKRQNCGDIHVPEKQYVKSMRGRS